MSAIVTNPIDSPPASANHSAVGRMLDRVDRWCVQIGDWLNPILVKETRQALKSRQFLVTFSLLLAASFGWTVLGSLLKMPQIYTSPTGPYMLVGYYVVLAVPMLLVVPLAAYRSLESELDDGTLELLSITVLSPWQIAIGKLASALLQMTLYFIALFPCVAFAYTLRGVDLPTLLIVMGLLFVAGLVLTIFSLTIAPQSRTRNGRIVSLLVVIGTLFVGEYAIGGACISMILFGLPFESGLIKFSVIFVVLSAVVLGVLLLTTTAMMLTPESENRSTKLRLAMLLLTAVMLGLSAAGLSAFEGEALAFAIPTHMFLGVLWLVATAMMVAESSKMTPRVRRGLPSSFVGRLALTYLTPGPATGLVFGVVGMTSVIASASVSMEHFEGSPAYRNFGPLAAFDAAQRFIYLFGAYFVILICISRWLIALIRRWQNVRVEIGVASLIAVSAFAALVPYSLGLYFSNSLRFQYSGWQITNWPWTLSQHYGGTLDPWIMYAITAAAMILFTVSVAVSSEVAMPRKTAMPQRVRDELDAAKA